VLRTSGRTMKFEGYLKVYREEKEDEVTDEEEDEESAAIPPLKEGDLLTLKDVITKPHKTSPPPNYNEASIIKTLEKHGIGRPSTYAVIIKNIVDRGYIKREKDRRLLITELGALVTDKLKDFFPDIMDISYTAAIEDKLDDIADGAIDWVKMIKEFYGPFAKNLESANKDMIKTRPNVTKTDEKCPLCEQPMLIRESRFGKYLSCSAFPKCKGKIQLNPDGQKIVPEKTDEVCDVCGKGMVIRTGRKGRFLACSGYPACKNTFSLDADGKKIEGSRPLATVRKCQKCSSFMWLRLGKRGHFLACSGFPKCRNIKPVSKEEGEKLRVESEALRAANAQRAAQA